jgi:hypothetical protein
LSGSSQVIPDKIGAPNIVRGVIANAFLVEESLIAVPQSASDLIVLTSN